MIERHPRAVRMEAGKAAVAQSYPVVAGAGCEIGRGSRVEDGLHAPGEALAELKLVLLERKGRGVDCEAELVRGGAAFLLEPGGIDGVLLWLGLCRDVGWSAAQRERKRDGQPQAAHVRSIHRELAAAAEKRNSADEDAAGGEGEEANGTAVGALGGRGCGGGVVAALGAALGMSRGRQEEEGGDQEEGRPHVSDAICNNPNRELRALRRSPVEKQIPPLRYGMTTRKQEAEKTCCSEEEHRGC